MKGQLARWIKDEGLSREDVAEQLGVSRRYVDALCREQRVPKAEVMDGIHRLTRGQITSAYWAMVDRARKKAKI
jgi:transcriptional regulator with XRE-family HTH domain